ncbi:glycoside hydrolase family 67 protein [Hyaloscypha variabilis F]|uniref:Alpha-glucuronidase n=1 Tax=Hyaloscypha variabilis (strain UAMH 11265 / GT02V1 / F) TaxID=1149755 RepID=A0A2J6S1L0_HYAVF|nr:glycoside hydrolase family 67 protein [Hyaloscypha variabilis F]
MLPSLLLYAVSLGVVAAENGLKAWLRYAPLPNPNAFHLTLASNIIALNTSTASPVYTASLELQKGIKDIFSQAIKISDNSQLASSSLIVGIIDDYNKVYGDEGDVPNLDEDGFWISTKSNTVKILGQNERGALYGAFEYLSMLAQGDFTRIASVNNPNQPIRWVNQWDNIDGSIERGYGGSSIFFKNGGIVDDLTRVSEYARLLASIRVNGIIVNNVNANATLLSPRNIQGLGRIAGVMRPYGIQVGISLNFASPTIIGGLSTFDPLDSGVISFWTNITDQIYQRIPDFSGYLVKANSEGQPGPLTYNRTLAQGANLFAKALDPHDGIVMFRAFVYDQLNESDWKADRANAAVQFFKELDGKFADNVVVQIKYGPIDFQKASKVSDIISSERFNRPLGGSAAVVNVGMNSTWLGSHMAMSNLYAYGRLAWDPSQDTESILQDWIRLTFGLDPQVLETITEISMDSWPAYEQYSGNLGIQTLTDITGNHFGPKPQSQDGNGWGQWTRADQKKIGMDRTVANETGFSGTYPPEIAGMYENIATTPDDLLLWFHHVNYTHVLHSGKTTFVKMWETLEGKIDDERYEHVLFRQTYQAGHSIVWRDAISNFYWNLSRIPDEAKRVGHHPWRVEAESMELEGYMIVPVTPFEAASNYTAIITSSNTTAGTASLKLGFPSGTYDLAVNYFDLVGGSAQWQVFLNNKLVGEWIGDHEDTLGHAVSANLDGHTASRITFKGIEAQKGDVLKIVGIPDGTDRVPLDYVAVLPPGDID